MELPRGMKDFDTDEMIKIEFVRQTFLDTAKTFGFDLIEPSPIELLSVLEAKSGPSIRDEIYQFKDKGDREVALRFDFTVGLTRYAASQKNLKLPAKFSSFGGVWRYDEPQKGRYRFFHQWNIETFGNLNTEHDAELIEFTSRFFDNLKLQNISIDINHRKLVESYINQIFESNDTTLLHDIFRAVDKIQKKSKNEILEEYKKKGYSPERLEKILNFSDIKGSPTEIEENFDIRSLTTQSGANGWYELCALYESLKNRGINNIRINFGIIRGLDYYTGIIFEAFDSTSDLGALVGGGRYDSLPNAFGRDDLGATGVAGGIERIILCLDDSGVRTYSSTYSGVSVLYVNDELKPHAINCASKLRQLGISVNVDLTAKPLKKQMEMYSNSKFCVIFAPKEFSEKQVVLRNMTDRTEKQISLDELISEPEGVLNL